MQRSLEQWLKENPPPNAQALAEKFGGLSKIPVNEWQRFDRAKRKWEKQRLAQARRSD
jgi:hypothetical protein